MGLAECIKLVWHPSHSGKLIIFLTEKVEIYQTCYISFEREFHFLLINVGHISVLSDFRFSYFLDRNMLV